MSPTSYCNFTVAIGASICPLATIIWNSGGEPPIKIVCDAGYRILRKSAAGKALGKTHVSMRPSMFNSLKCIGKYRIFRLIFSGKFVDIERNLVSSSGDTWSCGKLWFSMTVICLWCFCALGRKLGNGYVSGNCGFTAPKSINTNRPASDICEFVIRSILSI